MLDFVTTMCSLRSFTKMNGKHADMEVIVKSNDFPREETQSLSLGRTKPIVVGSVMIN
jgi:hypothetical protein